LINIDSWVKFYNFWPKNDVEKWSRRNVYEIATCGSHFLLIHILNRREADYPYQSYRLVSTTFGDGPPWLHVCCACVSTLICRIIMLHRGVINGKAGKHLPYPNFETTVIL
jgi:hypothetical protein